MKTGVTILTTKQIGIDTWRDVYVTKVFEESATLKDIYDWAKSVDSDSDLSSLRFSKVVES